MFAGLVIAGLRSIALVTLITLAPVDPGVYVNVPDLWVDVNTKLVGVNTPAVPVPESAGVIVIGGEIWLAGRLTVNGVDATPFVPDVGPVNVRVVATGISARCAPTWYGGTFSIALLGLTIPTVGIIILELNSR
jgi:hypothetical protein